nr:MAG TPA: hypothetical protein [Caudoviricetes sp.]
MSAFADSIGSLPVGREFLLQILRKIAKTSLHLCNRRV